MGLHPSRTTARQKERAATHIAPSRQSLTTDLIRRYTVSPLDLAVIRQRRGAANRLGFAAQFSYLHYPGFVLGVDQLSFPPLLHVFAEHLEIPVEEWADAATELR